MNIIYFNFFTSPHFSPEIIGSQDILSNAGKLDAMLNSKLCRVSLTQEDQVPIVFQHHVLIESLLFGVQAFPFLSRKIDGHILEGQRFLE